MSQLSTSCEWCKTNYDILWIGCNYGYNPPISSGNDLQLFTLLPGTNREGSTTLWPVSQGAGATVCTKLIPYPNMAIDYSGLYKVQPDTDQMTQIKIVEPWEWDAKPMRIQVPGRRTIRIASNAHVVEVDLPAVDAWVPRSIHK